MCDTLNHLSRFIQTQRRVCEIVHGVRDGFEATHSGRDSEGGQEIAKLPLDAAKEAIPEARAFLFEIGLELGDFSG